MAALVALAGWSRPTTPDPSLVDRMRAFGAMGGRVNLRVSCRADEADLADRALRVVEGRIHAWARRLTRFDERSDLCRLNRSTQAGVALVGPTLGRILEQAAVAGTRTGGLVDVSMLEARLHAEVGTSTVHRPGAWSIRPRDRRFEVQCEQGSRFDLDGVAKGWLADRALALLSGFAAAMVDADGDVAMRVPMGSDWHVAIADPHRGSEDLAVMAVPSARSGAPLGIGTSGTTVHAWETGHGWAHHLIDPRTGYSAWTDVIQATVVAESALAAESLAKAAVIEGADGGLALLERAGAWAAFLLLRDGAVVASQRSSEWMA